MSDPSPSQTTPPVHGEVIPEAQARQGRRGLHMLAVLIVSIVLVLVIFAGLSMFRSHPATDATPAAAAERTAGATKGT